jgi:thymidylate synthase
MLPVHLVAENLDDLWHQALYLCFKFGFAYPVEHGSYEGVQNRYEFDFFTARIKDTVSYLVPLMPEGIGMDPPTSVEYVENYFANYLMADDKTDKEDYRYSERLVNAKHRPLSRPNLSEKHILTGETFVLGQTTESSKLPANGGLLPYVVPATPINQVDEIIRMFAERGPNTNQATMEIGMPPDVLLADPPCCRLIDCRVRYGKLHFFIYFRSWDLFAGLPANLGGMELLKRYMVDLIRDYPDSKLPDLGNGEMHIMSKGLHIYDMYAEVVEARFGKTKEKIREEGLQFIEEKQPSMIAIGA